MLIIPVVALVVAMGIAWVETLVVGGYEACLATVARSRSGSASSCSLLSVRVLMVMSGWWRDGVQASLLLIMVMSSSRA